MKRLPEITTLLSLLLTGCGATAPADDPPRLAELPASTSEARMLEVAKRLPSFAGVFLDEQGRVTVLIKRTAGSAVDTSSTRRSVSSALETVYGKALTTIPGKPPRPRDLVVKEARYNVSELARWRDHLRRHLNSFADVVSLDLDERANQVRLGVSSAAARELALKQIRASGLVADAIAVDIVAPYVYQKSLRNKFRPMIGGIQLEIDVGWTANKKCTMGFSATRAGQKGFIANSHCSKKMAKKDDGAFHQPDDPWYTEDNKVGYEAFDPPYLTGDFCPAENKCRIADATFVKYGNSSRDGGAAIAQAEGDGSRETIDPPLRIVAHSSFPIAGFPLSRVGRTTGLRSGVIQSTCTDITIDDVTDLCQTVLERVPGDDQKLSDGGDSGSPVFYDLGGGNVYLAGIHYAGRTDGSTAIFSPIDSVRSALWPIEIAIDPLTPPPLPPVVCADDEYCCETADNGGCIHCSKLFHLCPFPQLEMSLTP